MVKNYKIKLVAAGIIALFAGMFLFFKRSHFSGSQNQPSAQEQFSVIPASNSLLVAMHSPVLGPQDAPITIVEFLDPECEACGAMYPVVKQLMKEYEGKIKLVVRYMPFHGNSIFAGNVLEAAKDQGKFWEALEVIFKNQDFWASHDDPKPEFIFSIIKPLGLDLQKVQTAVESGQYNRIIDQDKADGQKLGVTRTPTFFVNGEQLYEMGYEPLKQLILKKIETTSK